MSAPGRWLRMDVGCFESEWLAALSISAQHAWTRLLLHTKSQGTGGSVKRLGPVAAERLWSIPPVSLHEMETAAIADGALGIEDGWWIITGWDKYQQPDRTNSIRKQRLRDKRKEAKIPPVSPGTYRSPPGTRHATETLTGTETTSTPTTAVRVGKRKPRTSPPYTPEFGELWKIRPKGPKPEAFEAYRAAVGKGTLHEQMTYALGRYVREQLRPGFDGVHLHRWLEGERWEEYANGNGSHPKAHRLGT